MTGATPYPMQAKRRVDAIRDKRIVELRREGWTLADIAAAVHMSEGGVSRALQRLSGESNTSED
jgi:AraC-like DNA-binding protein